MLKKMRKIGRIYLNQVLVLLQFKNIKIFRRIKSYHRESRRRKKSS